MSTECCGATSGPRNAEERKTLIWVFWLNASLSAVLLITGLLADSSGLLANAIDNASDAGVYAISLYAIGRDDKWKQRAAMVSGVMLLLFAAGVLLDVYRRYQVGTEPIGPAMMGMALLAAGINIWCIKLLRKNRDDDVNMRAAWTFSLNDLFANLGILVAGLAVLLIGKNWPDLVVGVLIASIAVKGGINILRDALKGPDSVQSNNGKS